MDNRRRRIMLRCESRATTADNWIDTNRRETVWPHFANREYAEVNRRNRQPLLSNRSPTRVNLRDYLAGTTHRYEPRILRYSPSASSRTVSRNVRDLSIVSGRSRPIADCSIIA